MSTVLESAWSAAGRCRPAVVDPGLVGACARCCRYSELAPSRTVISQAFTAFDDWENLGGSGLCPACTWAYITPELRAGAWIVTTSSTAAPLDRVQLAQILTQSLPADAAVTVPLHPGRKHIITRARWGRVALDNIAISWTDADATRLATVQDLRAAGFGSRQLMEPAAPFSTLRKLPTSRWQTVIESWRSLDVWRDRADNPWLALAVHATMPKGTK